MFKIVKFYNVDIVVKSKYTILNVYTTETTFTDINYIFHDIYKVFGNENIIEVNIEICPIKTVYFTIRRIINKLTFKIKKIWK